MIEVPTGPQNARNTVSWNVMNFTFYFISVFSSVKSPSEKVLERYSVLRPRILECLLCQGLSGLDVELLEGCVNVESPGTL